MTDAVKKKAPTAENLQGSRIIGIRVENFKRVEFVQFKPSPTGLTLIAGANGQGKSSTIDAVLTAFKGIDKKDLERLRKGQTKCTILVKFGNEDVTCILEKKIGAVGQELNVWHDGKKITSPQSLLDALVGSVAFDPLAFTELKPKEQAAELMEVMGLTAKLDELDLKRKTAYTTRTGKNSMVKELNGKLAGQAPDPSLPAKPHDLTILDGQIDEAWKLKSKQEQRELEQTNSDREVARLEKRIQDLDRELSEAKGLYETEVEKNGGLKENLKDKTLPDVDALKAKRAKQADENQKLAGTQAYWQRSKERDGYQSESEKLTKEIEKIDATKAKLVKDSKLPIEGVEFGDDGVTFNGFLLTDCALSERIRIGLAVAIVSNPGLKACFIREGSATDSGTRAEIARQAEAAGIDVFMEVVDETGQVGITIVEGKVAAVDGVPVEPAAAAPAEEDEADDEA